MDMVATHPAEMGGLARPMGRLPPGVESLPTHRARALANQLAQAFPVLPVARTARPGPPPIKLKHGLCRQ